MTAPAHAPRLLVVEDEEELRATMADLLRGEGYQVREAMDGRAALEVLEREGRPDLVLLDLRMPRMSGWQFRVEQRRRPAYADIPVIVFSGDDSPEAEAIDATRYLKKPVDLHVLLAEISRVLAQVRGTSGDSEALAGQEIVPGLRLLEPIGAGGMGVVYAAERRQDGAVERVAVKVLSPRLAAQAEAVRRFANEARAVALIRHENIVQALDVGTTPDGLPFLVLEFLEGETLGARLARDGPLPVPRAVAIAREIAAGLAAAHRAGVVHRDLTPANVFLTGERAKILDFGVSKLASGGIAYTRTGELLGTPTYMAPEQLGHGGEIDQRTDVYGLGATLYQMLAGRPPFASDHLPTLFVSILHRTPTPLDRLNGEVPAELAQIVERALAKRPEARQADVSELAAQLARFADGARPAAPSRRPRWRSTLSVGRPLLVAASLVGLSIGAWALYRSSSTGAVALVGGETPSQAGAELHVTCRAPGATLRFRGETHRLPAVVRFVPSAAREVLEIRAPGRIGRRLVVLPDRSLRLDVELPEGSGIAEASPEELARWLRH